MSTLKKNEIFKYKHTLRLIVHNVTTVVQIEAHRICAVIEAIYFSLVNWTDVFVLVTIRNSH